MVRFKAKKKEKKKKNRFTAGGGRHHRDSGWYSCGLFDKHAEQRMIHESRRTIEDINQALRICSE